MSNKLNYMHLADQADRYSSQGDGATAARFYGLAGAEAARHYANAEAIEFFGKALSHTTDAQIAERFSYLLGREKVYSLQGNQTACKQDLASLEFLANVLQSDRCRAEVTVRRAQYFLQTGGFDTAVSFAQTAVRLAQIGGSAPLEAAAYLVWGTALIRQGSYDWAQTQLALALKLAHKVSDPQLQADCLRVTGLLYINQADSTQARFSYHKAGEIYNELGDKQGQSYILNNLGHIAFNRRHLAEAQKYWLAATAMYEAIGERLGRGMVFCNLGAMHMDIGDYAQAQTCNEDALAICRDVQSPMGQGMALLNLALISFYQDQPQQALEYSRQALELGIQMESRRIQGYAFIPMGHAHLALGQPGEAQEAYWQSVAIWKELSQPNLELEQQAGLARAFLAQDRKDDALALIENILPQLPQGAVLEGVESPFRVYYTCFEVLQQAGDDRARPILQSGHALLQETAAGLPDEKLRQSYLQNVGIHQKLISAYKENFQNLSNK